jgi:hypothetical protein
MNVRRRYRGTVEMPHELRALDEWRRLLLNELVVLPRTLSDFREGVENFRVVTQRLAEATAAFDQITKAFDQRALADLRSRLESANRLFRDQVGNVPGGERVAGALDDLNESLAAVVRLNPFWPRPSQKEPPP